MNKGKTPPNQSIHLTCISLALMQAGDFQRSRHASGAPRTGRAASPAPVLQAAGKRPYEPSLERLAA